MYENSFRLRGKTYDYKIQYEHIKKFMLLPKPDDLHNLITIGLDPPLRQGQTRYPFLVMQFKREEEVIIELNMTEYVSSPMSTILSANGVQGNAGRQIQRQVDASLRAAAAHGRRSSVPWLDWEESCNTIKRLLQPPPAIRSEM